MENQQENMGRKQEGMGLDNGSSQTTFRNALEDERSDEFIEDQKRHSSDDYFVNNGFNRTDEDQLNAQISPENIVTSPDSSFVGDSELNGYVTPRSPNSTPGLERALDSRDSSRNSTGYGSPVGSDSVMYEPHFVTPLSLNDSSVSYAKESPPHTLTEKTPAVVVLHNSKDKLKSSHQFDRFHGLDSVSVENAETINENKETITLVPLTEQSNEQNSGTVVQDANKDSGKVIRDNPKDETLVQDIDVSIAASSATLAEEKGPEVEWQDVMGNGTLMKRTIKKGQPGTRPIRNSVATIRCSAVILETNDFDANSVLRTVDVHDQLRFTVSDLEVIQGLELAVQLMDIDEIAEVKVDPRFAYGELGNQETDVPADAKLLYTIELLKVEPPVELENISVPERIAIANHKVDRGNFWYLRKESMLALSLYQRAVSILESPSQTYSTPEDNSNLDISKARAYGNLSSAQVEEQIWDEGLRSVENALRYDPNNGKLWCRKIKIFREKGQFEEAVETCEEVLKRGALIGDQFIKKARDELSNMRKKKRQADEKEKAMYQRMLGSSPKPSSDSDRNIYLESKSSSVPPTTSNRKWLFFATTAAVAVFGVLVGLRYYQQHH